MMTNEIVGIDKVDGPDFPDTLDRLTQKVKAQKNSILKTKKKFQNGTKKGDVGYTNGHGDKKQYVGSANGDGSINQEWRKRKAPLNENDSSKKTKIEGGDSANTNEKPDWKVMKQERKDLKEARKQKKAPEMYALSKEAKLIWEDLRQTSCPKDKKATLSNKLYALIAPHLKKFVFAHDTVRVIECLVALGGEKIRGAIFDELKDQILVLIKDKYAHFFVLKVLKYGNKAQKSFVMKAMEGQVVGLLRRQVASSVVESAYNDYANAKERSSMIQEFFGPEFRHFKVESATNLDMVLEQFPEKREIVMKNFKQNLLNVISKSPWKLTIVHTLLAQFLAQCDDESRADLIELIKNDLIHILHTRDGARVAMMCIWHGTAKDRKVIVKSFKTHVVKICTDDHGYMVMLAILDSVDDTKLVSKALLQEMLEGIEDVMQSMKGRKVISYIIKPRYPSFFHPQIVEILAKGDGNKHSKKEKDLRFKEILSSVENDLIGCFERNLEKWIADSNIRILLKTLVDVTYARLPFQELKALFQKIISVVCSEPKYVEDQLMFKTISDIIAGGDNPERIPGQVEFSYMVLTHLDQDQSALKHWLASHRGCTVLFAMIKTDDKKPWTQEGEPEGLIARMIELIKPHKKLLVKAKKDNAPASQLHDILVKNGF